MFKVNPKQMALSKVQFLVGRDKNIKVDGKRLTPQEAKHLGYGHGVSGTYLAECKIDGDIVASATDPDWRMAYKKLKLVLEKLYTKKP